MSTKLEILNALQQVQRTPLEFHYEQLVVPPLWAYLSPWDVNELYKIASSASLSGQMLKKLEMIDFIMRNRGFKKFAGGTNRVVYRHLEDKRIVAKVAIDQVGLQDNPMEFRAQNFIKPYCAKMFYTSPNGAVGIAERVIPITNKQEFEEAAPDIFMVLVCKILGRFVVEDVGTLYFKNYGIRPGWGPVILDYPYVYPLDGKRLYCTAEEPAGSGIMCDGEIDYDDGFNFLECQKCGRIYRAIQLRENKGPNSPIRIALGGKERMKVVMKRGNTIVAAPQPETRTIQIPKQKQSNGNTMKVSIRGSRGVPADPAPKIPSSAGSASSQVRDMIKDKDKKALGTNTAKAMEQATEEYKQLNLSDQIKIDDSNDVPVIRRQMPGPVLDDDQECSGIYYLVVDNENSIFTNWNQEVFNKMSDEQLMEVLRMVNHVDEDFLKKFAEEIGLIDKLPKADYDSKTGIVTITDPAGQTATIHIDKLKQYFEDVDEKKKVEESPAEEPTEPKAPEAALVNPTPEVPDPAPVPVKPTVKKASATAKKGGGKKVKTNG